MSNVKVSGENTTGFEGGFSIGKVGGAYQYSLEGSIRDKNYDVLGGILWTILKQENY